MPNFSYEKRAWRLGKVVAGVDEAGRGPLAGPVVAAAVVLPEGSEIDGLNDSKQLSPELRSTLYTQIKMTSVATSVGIVEPEEIDKINILRASLRAMEIAVGRLALMPDLLLIDGNTRTSLLIPQETIIKGDSKSFSIAAASIIAKVTRDSIMVNYHHTYPRYNFKQNKGYPTKEHLEALREFGPCPIHRRTFNGVLQTK